MRVWVDADIGALSRRVYVHMSNLQAEGEGCGCRMRGSAGSKRHAGLQRAAMQAHQRALDCTDQVLWIPTIVWKDGKLSPAAPASAAR